jgi:hypothetical protein
MTEDLALQLGIAFHAASVRSAGPNDRTERRRARVGTSPGKRDRRVDT